jgi:hypothetical protein
VRTISTPIAVSLPLSVNWSSSEPPMIVTESLAWSFAPVSTLISWTLESFRSPIVRLSAPVPKARSSSPTWSTMKRPPLFAVLVPPVALICASWPDGFVIVIVSAAPVKVTTSLSLPLPLGPPSIVGNSAFDVMLIVIVSSPPPPLIVSSVPTLPSR